MSKEEIIKEEKIPLFGRIGHLTLGETIIGTTCILFSVAFGGIFFLVAYFCFNKGYYICAMLFSLISIIITYLWLDFLLGEPPKTSGAGIGACFIATAAYETPMATEINSLKKFRDARLNTNPMGRVFVKLYYRASPSIANFIGKHGILKWFIRQLLKPIIFLINKEINKEVIQ